MEKLLRLWNLKGNEKGNVQVPCPLHGDRNPSASVNFEKGLFNCFSCKEGMTIEQLEERLEEETGGGEERDGDDTGGDPEGEEILEAPIDEDELFEIGEQFLRDRGFEPDEAAAGSYGVTVAIEDNPESKLYGYMIFWPAGQHEGPTFVGRNILDTDRARYRNSFGEKSVFLVGEDDGRAPVWMVEGIIDAMSVRALDHQPVVALLGSSLNEKAAYPLRGRTVFLLLDADYAGWKGASEISDTLEEVGANPIILELPSEFGNDPNDAYVADPEGFGEWLDEVKNQYLPNDTKYVSAFFEAWEPLNMVSTGIPEWDRMLGGGFKSGVHIIGAEPKAGKTALGLAIARRAVEQDGKRVLYLTYEVSKRQCWARETASYDKLPWSELEMNSTLASKKAREAIARLALGLRIEQGWTLSQIQHAIDEFDVVVVDYLQRMPSRYKQESIRHAVDENIGGLSDLARDRDKVIIVVSSFGRQSYGKVTLQSFKESGGVEYVVQSATGLIPYHHENLIMGNLVANTRGSTGTFWMEADYLHTKFRGTDNPRESGRIATLKGGS